ncbi:MAG: DUF1080 domain-containing protein [Tannerella sp.]|jgi:HEAT repeat protein|nr:DUF1080 domain-containing protein [Tannerella sp.]
MKRKLSSLISALLLCGSILTAQSPANRTAQTIIADVLAQMPADRQDDYSRQIGDLVSTGEEGILTLVKMLNPPGKGSNAPVDYALSGIAHYVSAAGQEAARQTAVNAFKKALTAVTDAEIKAFLNAQLRVLGEGEPVAAPVPLPLPKVTKNSPVHLRIAALQQDIRTLADPENRYDVVYFPVDNMMLPLTFEKRKEKELAALVLKALKDPSIEYRNAALNFASPYAGKEFYAALLKALPKAKASVKEDVLNWLGREAQSPVKQALLAAVETGIETTSVQSLQKELGSADFGVKQAAAWALVRLGQPQAIPSLAALLTGGDGAVIDLGRQTLASFDGNISSDVARVLSSAPDSGKIAGMKLLALRKATGHLNNVLELTKSDSPEVRVAAYDALKDVAGEKDLTNMCGMLESVDKPYVAPMQQAVISSLSSRSPDARVETLVRRIYQAGDSKKYLYYLPLATTGERRALDMIVDEFGKSRGEARDAAFDALLNWKGFEVAEQLYAVCTAPSASSYFDRALEAYVQLVSAPSLTGENRLIYLRKAMEIARTDAQKNAILTQTGKTGTFPALLYAGDFLDRSALKEAAATAVMTVALNHPEYTGENVVALLNRAGAALSNPDADYQRESIRKHLDEMPKEKGFVSIFNGKDLTGWKGLVENPVARAKMKPAELAKNQAKADEQMRKSWVIENGLLAFVGSGYDNLCTEKQYGDMEMYIDWMLDPAGPDADAGIYLRGTPQVQIWDTARVNAGAQVGSGGLYNNQVNESKPLKVADNRLGEWNTFYIKMVGDRVTVKLNGELVTDNVTLENYWNRELPVPPVEQIELQAHGSKVYYRNIYVKELERPEPFQLSDEEKKAGFSILFDGTNMHEWTGNLVNYTPEDGCIVMDPDKTGAKSHGNLYTKKEYANFIIRFDFQLTPAANNGLGIRTPMDGDAAYVGMELQILDSEHPVFRDLQKYQYHGSVYGILAAKRGFLKPAGEWNCQEVTADGDHIKVTLNGTVILDGNIREATKNGTPDGREHPGLFNKSGHIGFLGHGSPLKFRNIRIKTLK